MTCKNCRFWKPIPREDVERFSSFNTKKRNAQVSAWLEKGPAFGACAHEKIVDSDYPDTLEGLSYFHPSDHEYYGAGLVVGRDFGCIHWEAKL